MAYPSPFGYAVFIDCPSKAFVIYMDKNGGSAIDRALSDTYGERPLTHELIGYILEGLEVKVKSVLIYKEFEGTFYAEIMLSMKNELAEKVVEIDARPSDALTLAIRYKAPIFVKDCVLNNVEDVRMVLDEIRKKNS